MKLWNKSLAVGAVVSGLVLITGATASAHVVVTPSEAVTAGFQTFTIGVPNEKDVATTSIKLTLPAGLKHVTPTQKTGWKVTVEEQGKGEAAAAKSLTWSGNEIKPERRDEFTFSAQVPDKPAELAWKAYQTYDDGTVVAWDQPADSSKSSDNAGPFSVTRIVSETSEIGSLHAARQAAIEARRAANTALYTAVAGVVVGLVGIYLATRQK